VVPKEVYPESHTAMASRRMNWILTNKLREFAAELREDHFGAESLAHAQHDATEQSKGRLAPVGKAERKAEMLRVIHRILCIHRPPATYRAPATSDTWRLLVTPSLR